MMESVNFKPHESETETNDTQKMVNEFTKIYKQYYRRVFKYICYRINDQHMAEELCSQVFEKIIEKYNGFSGDEKNLESWIFTIARNIVTDYYRTKGKKFHFSLDYIIDMISPKPSPDEAILTKENNSYLFEALSRLNEKERSVVSLKYGADLKNTEIAKLMGLSESNVSVILYRSLKKLKKILVSGGFKYE